MLSKLALFPNRVEPFALPIERIVQIVETPRVFPLPLLPVGFTGVLLHQGEIIPCLDPVALFGVDPGDVPGPYSVIYAAEPGHVALAVERIGGVVDAGRGRFEPAGEKGGKHFIRLFVFAEKRYSLLDIDKWVALVSAENFPAPPVMGARRIG